MNNKNQLTGVLLAAGKGLRAYPSTKFVPKPLLKINGETILSYNIKNLINTFKVKEIFIVVGHLNKQIIRYINNKKYNIKITFVKQNKIDGIANALLLLKSYLNKKKIILILADEYYHNPNYNELLSKINTDYASILTFKRENNKNIISKNFIGKLQGKHVSNLIEKPKNPKTDIMGVGTYFFDDRIFKYIEKTNFSKLRGEKEITDVISIMAKNEKVGFNIIDCEYFNISTRTDLINANYFVRGIDFHQKK